MDAENNKENFLERVDKMMNKLMKAVTDENGNIADTPLAHKRNRPYCVFYCVSINQNNA